MNVNRVPLDHNEPRDTGHGNHDHQCVADYSHSLSDVACRLRLILVDVEELSVLGVSAVEKSTETTHRRGAENAEDAPRIQTEPLPRRSARLHASDVIRECSPADAGIIENWRLTR